MFSPERRSNQDEESASWDQDCSEIMEVSSAVIGKKWSKVVKLSKMSYFFCFSFKASNPVIAAQFW